MTERERYPENAPGPFYVEADLCILCGTPATIAPDLVGMNEGTATSRDNRQLKLSLDMRLKRSIRVVAEPIDTVVMTEL